MKDKNGKVYRMPGDPPPQRKFDLNDDPLEKDIKIQGTMNLHGLPVQIISQEDAEKCTMVVCMRDHGPPYPLEASVNHRGKCAFCQHPIYWSRTAPLAPPKVCVECTFEMTKAEEQRRNEEAQRATGD